MAFTPLYPYITEYTTSLKQPLQPLNIQNIIIKYIIPEIPCSRHSEANPIFRLSQCHNNLSQQLENPLDFSLSINRAAILLKKQTITMSEQCIVY